MARCALSTATFTEQGRLHDLPTSPRTHRGGLVIHADNNAFDARLRGYAYEGACMGEGDSGVEEAARGKINCADCLRIIWHSKGIPNRVLAIPACR